MEPQPLSRALRAATTQAHRDAERHPFTARLLQGTISTEAYARYLSSLERVYTTLEDALQRDGTPELAPFADPALFRGPAIRADLGALGHRPPPTPSAERWTTHLRDLQHSRPVGLIGHIYTRYLGDLSGGQVIGRRLVAAGTLPPNAVQLYRFDQIADIRSYTAAFRESLDRLDARHHLFIIGEARSAFFWTADIFSAVCAR